MRPLRSALRLQVPPLVLFVLGAVLLTACGGEEAGSASETDASADRSGAQGAVDVRRVSDDPAVRQRLTPPQLLTYVPDALGPYEAATSARRLSDTKTEAGPGISHVSVQFQMYDAEKRRSISMGMLLQDLIDDPPTLQSTKTKIETGRGLQPFSREAVGEARPAEHGVARTHTHVDDSSYLYVLLVDRFALTFDAIGRQNDLTPDDLWDLYRTSALTQLAGAPVYAEAPRSDPPSWAADAVAEWRAEVGADSPDAPPVETVAGTRSLPPCDTLLPVGAVESACGVTGVRVSPTDFEQEGKQCNRVYRTGEGRGSGLVFKATHYGTPDPARRAVAAVSDTSEYAVAYDRLPDLGQGGFREHTTSENTPDRYELAFSHQNLLLELNTRDSPFDRPEQKLCLSLDELERVARSIDETLSAQPDS